MPIELFELVEPQELYQVLNCGKGRTRDILVLLGGAAPDCVDDVVAERVLFVYCPDIGQLKRASDQLSVRVLNVNVLQNLRLRDERGEVLEIQEAADGDLP